MVIILYIYKNVQKNVHKKVNMFIQGKTSKRSQYGEHLFFSTEMFFSGKKFGGGFENIVNKMWKKVIFVWGFDYNMYERACPFVQEVHYEEGHDDNY